MFTSNRKCHRKVNDNILHVSAPKLMMEESGGSYHQQREESEMNKIHSF